MCDSLESEPKLCFIKGAGATASRDAGGEGDRRGDLGGQRGQKGQGQAKREGFEATGEAEGSA